MSFLSLEVGHSQTISLLTSLPAGRETHHAEQNEGYFNFASLKLCTHFNIYIIFSHYACAISDPKHVGTFAPKNYHRVVVAAPDL
jgi:hypothetical protein